MDALARTHLLAAASGKAVFREPGFEDEGNHSFVLYVEDQDEQGCGQDPADELWFELLDKDGNQVTAATFFGAAQDEESEDGAKAIEFGNILVPHKTGKRGGVDGDGPEEPNPNKPPKS